MLTPKSDFFVGYSTACISSYCIHPVEIPHFDSLNVDPSFSGSHTPTPQENSNESIIPPLSKQDYQSNISNSTAVPAEAQQDFLNHYLHKGFEMYTNHVSPFMTKEKIDQWFTNTVIFSSYYGTVGSLGTGFSSKAGVAMGFKLFASMASPFVSQFVESFTEIQVYNAKYTYHTLRCIFDEGSCIELNLLTNEPFHPSQSLLNDFSQFDYQRYYQEVSAAADKLSTAGLINSGILSATASNIKDFVFNEIGFTPYCQGYFCKNWLSYYFKDWIKNELKKEEEKIQENFFTLTADETASTPASPTAIILGEVITQETTIPGLGSAIPGNIPIAETAASLPFYHYLNPSNLAGAITEHLTVVS